MRTKTLALAAVLAMYGTASARPDRVPEHVPPSKLERRGQERLLVCVTFWRPDDCPFGWKSSTGVRLRPLKSAAVDPRIIPYGAKIELPYLEEPLRAEDTGSSVKAKKASGIRAKWALRAGTIKKQDFRAYATAPVIDVCVKSEKDYRRLCKKYPHFVTATITTL